MLNYVTAGESHGKALMCIINGVPAGFSINAETINEELARRQLGYGRGGRMQIEKDKVKIISGVRGGKTLGSPVGLLIENRDWSNWQQEMSPETADADPVVRPRPGHADLAGACKYSHTDLRNVLERASARETAARVAAGAVASSLLRTFDIWIIGWVAQIGGVHADISISDMTEDASPRSSWRRWRDLEPDRPLRCPDTDAERDMIKHIDEAKESGDTLGGVVEVAAVGVPPGLGSYSQWDRRLDGRLAAAVMSVPAIKGVEIGMGFGAAERPGSQVHDPIRPSEQGRGWHRCSNNAGGLEGGVSNGEPVLVRGAMKPIATLGKPLDSVDLHTGELSPAHFERADVCAVPAAGVVVEAGVAFELARAFLQKFGGDSLQQIKDNHTSYMERLP